MGFFADMNFIREYTAHSLRICVPRVYRDSGIVTRSGRNFGRGELAGTDGEIAGDGKGMYAAHCAFYSCGWLMLHILYRYAYIQERQCVCVFAIIVILNLSWQSA